MSPTVAVPGDVMPVCCGSSGAPAGTPVRERRPGPTAGLRSTRSSGARQQGLPRNRAMRIEAAPACARRCALRRMADRAAGAQLRFRPAPGGLNCESAPAVLFAMRHDGQATSSYRPRPWSPSPDCGRKPN